MLTTEVMGADAPKDEHAHRDMTGADGLSGTDYVGRETAAEMRWRFSPSRIRAPAHRRYGTRGVLCRDRKHVHRARSMKPITSFLVFVFLVAAVIVGYFVNLYFGLALFAVSILIGSSIKMAYVWQKFVILRLGKLQSVRGAGLFAIIPVVDTVIAVIDVRIQTTAFNAEQSLTKDTVPVNVDAIVFWRVHDAEKAALAITDYRLALDRVAQTSLREMIGSSMLATLLSDRKQGDERLKVEIGEKTAPWGISVNSVEIRDVAIPSGLQDAMSRQAQAEREKQARVILGSSEEAIAHSFVAAADSYAGHPMALQLRAMNIVYETTLEKGATILLPTSLVDSMNPSAKLLSFAMAGNEALKLSEGLDSIKSPEAALPSRTAA